MTDETTSKIIERITKRFEEPQAIPSGHQVKVFYDCLCLTPSELSRLAAEAVGDLEANTFDMAIGLAYTGIFFASAVAGGHEVAILQHDNQIFGPSLKGKRVVLVDDVIVSGSKLGCAVEMVESLGAKVVGFACIVDRSCGDFESKNVPLWSAYVNRDGVEV